jgi:hypothetical protein
MDIDLRQGMKAIANTIAAVRPGGLLIDFVRAEEGVGHMGSAGAPSWMGRRTLRMLAPLLLRVLARSRSARQGQEFKFFAYFALEALRRNDLIIYAPTVPREFAARAPTAEFSRTIDETWTLARRKFPGRADVLVFPAGGVTFPIL